MSLLNFHKMLQSTTQSLYQVSPFNSSSLLMRNRSVAWWERWVGFYNRLIYLYPPQILILIQKLQKKVIKIASWSANFQSHTQNTVFLHHSLIDMFIGSTFPKNQPEKWFTRYPWDSNPIKTCQYSYITTTILACLDFVVVS